jgi:hypothetical protein
MLNRIAPLILTILVIVPSPACHDALAPERGSPLSAHLPQPAEPSNGPPVSASNTASVSDEFETAATILRHWTDTGFDFSWAYAQAFMRFFANRAETRVEMSLRNGNSIVATRTGRTSDGWLLPAYREQWAQTTAGVGASCGHVVDATSFFRAWHEAQTPFGRIKWSEKQKSSSDSELQPPCSSSCADQLIVTSDDNCDEASGGGGGDAGDESSEDGGPTGGLDCHDEFVVIMVDGQVIYRGVARVCE